MLIEIYCDGSATVYNKPGGYGWVLVIDGVKHSEGNGHMLNATNNDAELEAAVQGMAEVVRFLMANPQDDLKVHLRSDSQIVLNWANGSSKFTQKAKEMKYKQLRSLFLRLKAETHWIRGHSGHEHNERCDQLANLGRHKLTPQDEMPSKAFKKKVKKIGKRTEDVICLYFKNVLKLVDFSNNIVENYNPTLHGQREVTTVSIGLDLGGEIR